jgi:MFS family permease
VNYLKYLVNSSIDRYSHFLLLAGSFVMIKMKIKLTTWLKVLVFIDFMAVALVVPTLSSYFRDAGMNTQSYGLISSLYSSAQLIGGLILGILSDHMSKRSILLLSFVGSGVSYLMVGFCKHYFLLLSSRVIVGLVKQTMTTTTLMIAELTEDNHNLRTQEMGRISAISTLSFVIGPSLGGLLYKYDKRLPAVIACSLFFINCCICLAFIPNYTKNSTSKSTKGKNSSVVFTNGYNDINWRALPSLVVNFLQSKGNLAFLFRFSLLFIQSSMSSRNILNYYEDRFGI